MPSFSYQAQTAGGQTLNGTLAAENHAAAQRVLDSLQLRVVELSPAETQRRSKRALSGADFQAFNQQLAYLTSAGLPIEQGIRLIARDISSGKIAAALRAVSDDLQRGVPLGEAFAQHERQFPRLFARLIEAGVQTNSLPAMLLSLNRHLELLSRLRAALWRAIAYPLGVFTAFLLVLAFVTGKVIPNFESIYAGFRITLPDATNLLLYISPVVAIAALILAGLIVITPLIIRVGQMLGLWNATMDWMAPMPLIGPVIRYNLVARWCDALRLGVDAGLGLPQALELAGEATGSRALHHDSAMLGESLSRGNSLLQETSLTLLPPAVTAAMQVGVEQNDLAAVLGNLSEMYQQRANQRVELLPTILTPILMAVVAGCIGFLIMALFMPFIKLIQAVSSGD